MKEEEINDNLIMLKYFLQEEGDENWQDYCEAIQGLLDLYEQEKEKNKRLREIICKVRNHSSGVVCYDKINGKEYLSPRKNFTRQQLYKQFLEMQIRR